MSTASTGSPGSRVTGGTADPVDTADPADPAAPASELARAPERTTVDGHDVVGSLSPSRAAEFLGCPLRYRFRHLDRLPEPASRDAVRGSVVHAALDRLFDLPAERRTPEEALDLLEPAWRAVLAEEPEAADLFGPVLSATDPSDGDAAFADWWAGCEASLRGYFELEDPRRLEPAERESYVETVLEGSRLLLRGIVDRLDVSADGEIRIVDYKTGRAPAEGFEARAMFQMRFYALVLWRTRGVVPRMLRLVYLGSQEVLGYSPDEDDLLATQRKIEAVWRAIALARETGDYQPNRSPLCGWCEHQAICPAWGGTPPPLPPSPALSPELSPAEAPGASQATPAATDQPPTSSREGSPVTGSG